MILIEEKDKRFYLANSTIENAGVGVFAAQDIKKDEYLEIIGIMVDVDSIADKCTQYARDYKFAANFAGKFDRHIIPMGFGAMINHTENPEIQNAELRYIKHTSNNPASGSAVYYFIKDIKKDEEIFGNYGPGYQQRLEDEKYWQMFLDLKLYNLGNLKR